MGAYIDWLNKLQSCFLCPILLICRVGQRNGWIDNKTDDACPVRWSEKEKTPCRKV